MKVNLKNRMLVYSGKADDLVFCYNRFSGKMYARKRVEPRITTANESFGRASTNIFGIKPSEGYKRDIQSYLLGYNRLSKNVENPILSWSALYLHLMYKMARSLTDVSLVTLTREEIYSRNLPCLSIKTAVEAGILPAVAGYEKLVATI